MAASTSSLIARLVERSGGRLPNGPDAFGDVGGVHQAAINRLAAAAIVEGYGDGTYRPDELVSRAETASLVARALAHRRGAPLPGGSSAFDDVEGVHQQAVDRLAAVGIGQGFLDGTYRPDEPVTRAQMASYLARSLDLLIARG